MSDRVQQLVGLIETLLLLKSTSEEAANVFEKVIQSKANAHEGGLAGYLKEITADAKTATTAIAILEKEIKAVSALPVRAAADETPTSEGTRPAPVVSDAARKREIVQGKLDEERRAAAQEVRGDNRPAVVKRHTDRVVNYALLLEQLDEQIDEREDTLRDLVRRTMRKSKSAKTSTGSGSAPIENADTQWALTLPDNRPVVTTLGANRGRAVTSNRAGRVSVAQPSSTMPSSTANVVSIAKYVDTVLRHQDRADIRPENIPIMEELQKLIQERQGATLPSDRGRINQQIKQAFKKLHSSSGAINSTQRQTAQEAIIAPIIAALSAVKLEDPVLNTAMSASAGDSQIEAALSRAVEMLVTKLENGTVARTGESALADENFALLRPAAFDQLLKRLKSAVAEATTRQLVPRSQTIDPGISDVSTSAAFFGDGIALTPRLDSDIPSSSDALSNTRVLPQFITKLGAHFNKYRQSMRASLNPSLRYGPEAQGVDTRTGSQIVANSSSAVFGGGMDAAVQQAVDRLLAQVGEDISKGSMATARIAGSDVQLPQTLAKMVVEAIQTSSVLSEHTTAQGRMAGDKGPRGALETGDSVRKLIALFAGDLINQYRSTGSVSADAAQNFMDQTVTPPQEHEVTLALTHAMRLREKMTFQRDRADLDMVTASPQVAGAYRRDSIQLTKQIQLLDELLKVSDDPEEEKKLAQRRGQIALPMNEEQAALTRDQALTVLLRMPIGSVPAMPDAIAPIVQKAQQVSSGLRGSGLTVPVKPSYGTSSVQSLVDFFSAGQTQSLEKFQPIPLTKQLDEVRAPTSGLEQKDIVAIISDAFGLSRQSGSQGNAITGIFYGARATDGTGRIKTGDDLDQSLGGGYRTKNGLRSIVQASAEMQSYGSSGIPLIDYARLATATGRTEEEESMFEQVKSKLPHLDSIGEDQLKELAALDTSMDPQALIKRVMTLAAPAIQAHLTAFIKKQAKTAGMTSEQTEQLIDSGSAGENVPSGFESAFRVLQMFDPKNINSNDVTSEVNRAFSLFSTMLTDVVQPNESMPQLAARLLGREDRLEGAGASVAEALPDKNASFALLRAGGEVADTEAHRVTGSVYSRSVANQNNLTEALQEFEKLKAEIAELQSDISLKPKEADKITPIINQKIDQLQQVRQKLRLYFAAEPDPISMKFEALSTIVQSDTAGDTEKAGAVRDLALMQTIFKHTGRYEIDESQGFGSGTQEQRLAALLEHSEKEENLADLKRRKAALGTGGSTGGVAKAVDAVIEKSDIDGEIAAVTKDISAGKTAGSSTAPIRTSDVKSSAPETVTAAPETIDEQIARVQSEIAALETPATKLAREAAERGIKGQGEVAGRTYVHPDVSHGEPLTYVSRRSTLPLTEDYPQQLSKRFAKTGRIDISPEVAGSEAATIVNAAVAETLGLPIGPEVMPAVSEITPNNVPDTSTSNQASAGAVPYFFVPGQSEPMVVVGQSTGAFKGRGVAAPVMGTVDPGQTQWQAAEREAQEELGVVFESKADVPVTVAPSTNDAFYMRQVQSISPASAHFETQGVQIVPLSVAISQLESGRAGDQRDMQAGREALIALQTLIEEGVIVNDKEDVPIVDEDTAKMIELTAKLQKLQAEKEAMTTGQNPDDIVNEAISEAERRISELSEEAKQVSKLGNLQRVVSRAKTDQVNRAKSPPLGEFYGHVDTPTLRETAAPKGIPFKEAERIFEEVKQEYLTDAPVADDYEKINQQIEDLNLELVDEDSKKRERETQRKEILTQSDRGWNPTQKQQSTLMAGVTKLGLNLETGGVEEGSFFSEFSSPDLVFDSLKALAPTNKKGEIDIPWFLKAMERVQTDSEFQQQVKSTAEVLGVEPEPSEKAKQRSELQARRQIMSMFGEFDAETEGVQANESTTVGYRETVHHIARAREAEKQIKEIEKENESIIAARSIYDEAEQQTALELESLGIVPDDTSSDAVITAASAEISKLALGRAEKRQTTKILNVEQIQQLRKEAIHQLPDESLLDANLPGQQVSLRERIDFEAARVAQGMTGAPTVVPTLEGLLQNPDELLLDADGKPIIMYRGEDADQIAARLGEDPLVYAKDLQTNNLQSEIVFPVETPMAPGGASVYGQGFYHGVTQSEDVEGGHSAEKAKKVAVGYASSRGSRSFVHAAALKSTARLLNITPELVQEAENEVNQRREKRGLQPRKSQEIQQKSHITDTVEMLYRQTVDPNFRSQTDIDNEAQALLSSHGYVGNILSAEVNLKAAEIPEEVVQQVMKLKEEHAVTPSMEALAVGMGYDAVRFRTGVSDSRSASFLTLFNPGQSVVVSTPEYASRPEDQTGSTTREQTQVTSTERRAQELQKQLEEQKQLLAALKARSKALKQEAATASTSGADDTAVVEESKRVADETVKVSAEIKASTEEIQQREVDLDAQIAEAEKAVQRSHQQIAARQQQAQGGTDGDEEVYFTVDNTGGSVTLEEKQILDRTSLRPSVRTRMTAPDTGESLFVSNTNVPALVRAAQTVDPTTVDSVLASMTDEEMRRTGMPAAKLPEEFNWDQPSTLPKEYQKESGEPLTDEERAELSKTPAEYDAKLAEQSAKARDTIQSNYYQEEYTANDPKQQSKINVAAETKRKSTATTAKFLETATRTQKQEYYRYMRAFDAETETEEAVLNFSEDGDPAELKELQKKAEEARATRLALDESLKGTPVFAVADAEIDRYNADLVLQDATRNPKYDDPSNQAVRDYYETSSPDVKEALIKSTPGLAERVSKITEAEESMTAADKQRAALYLPARVAAEKDATPEQLVSRLFREAEKAVREYADEFTTVPEFTARDVVDQLVSSAAAQTSTEAPATSPAVASAVGETLTDIVEKGLPALEGTGGTMRTRKKKASPAATVDAVEEKYTAGALKTARNTVRNLSGRADLTPEQRRRLSAARQKLHANAIQKLTTDFGDNKGVMTIANVVAGLTPPDFAADPVQSARVSAISEAMSGLSPFALKKLQDVDLTNSVDLDRLSKDEELRPIMEMLASQDIQQALSFKSGTQAYDTASGVIKAVETAKESLVKDSRGSADAEEKKKLFFDLETTMGSKSSERKIYQAASGSEGGDVEELFAVPVPSSAAAIQAVAADTTLTDDEKRKQIRELALKRLGKKPYVEGDDVNPKVIDRLVDHAMGGGTIHTQTGLKEILKGQIKGSAGVVGHNIANFDLPIVYDDAVPKYVQAKTEDTLLMSRQAYPGDHSLSDTYMAVTGNPLVDAHDAAVDTRAVQEVYPSLATDEERRKLRARYLASRGIAPDSTVARLADIPQLDSIADNAERQKAFQQTAAAYTYYRPLAEMQDFTQNVVRSGGVTRIQGATDEQQATLFENMNKMFGTQIQADFGDGQTIETLDDKQLAEFVGYINKEYIKPNQSNAVDGDYGGMSQMLANKMGGPLTLRGFNRSNVADDFEKYATLEDRLAEGAMTGLSHDPTMTRATVGKAVSDLSAGKPTTVPTAPSSSTKPVSPTTAGGTTAGGGVRPPGGGSGLTTAASPGGSGGGGGSGFSSIGQATIDSLHAQNVAIEINGGTVNIHANFTDSAASKMTKSLVYISNKDGMNVNGDVTGMGGGGGGYRRVSPADRASFNVLEATKNDAAARLRDETDPAVRDALRQSLVRASERTIDQVIKPKAAKVLNPMQQSVFSSLSMGPEEALVSYNEMAQYNLNDLSTELATQEALPEGTAGRDTEIERLKAEIAAVQELIDALTELNAVEQRVGSASGTRNVNSSYGTPLGTGTGGVASKYYSRKSKEDEQVFLQLARNSFDQSAGTMGVAGSTTNDSRRFLTDLTRSTATTMINSSGIQTPGIASDIAAIAATSPEVQATYDEASKSLKDFSGKIGGTIADVADDLFTVVSGLEKLKAALTPLAATSPEAAAALQVVQAAIDETSGAGKEQRSVAGVIETDNRKKVSLVEEQMQAAASRPGIFAGGRRVREMRQIQEGYIKDTFGQQGLDALMHRGKLRAYTATGKRVDMAQATIEQQRETAARLQRQGINITSEDMTGIARMSGRVEQTKRSAPMGDRLFYAASKIRDSSTVIQTVLDTVASIPNIPQMLGSTIQQFASSATGSNRIMTTARGLALNPENYQEALGAAELQRKRFGGSLTSNLSEVSSFLPLSNAYGADLTKTVKVARKLAAFDPAQGMQGASIAIKEFLSGNVSSLSRRFEINRSALSKINTGDANQMIESLDGILSNMGVTDRLIDEQADSMATKYDKMIGHLESVQISLSTSLVSYATPVLESLLGKDSYFGMQVRERSLDSMLKETITSYGDDVLTDEDTGLGSVKLFGSTALFSSSMDEVLEAANKNMMEKAGEYNAATGATTQIAPYRLIGNMKPEERRKVQSDAINHMLGGLNQTQALMQAMRDNQLDYNIGSETDLQRESLSKLRKSNPAEYAKRVADKQTQLEKFRTQATQGMSEGSKLNKGNIERQVDIDTYDVRLADSGNVVRVRLPGIDAPESGTEYDMQGRAVAADVIGMKRSDIGRTLNNQGPIKEGVEVNLVGDLKDKDDSGRVVASILSKEGKNLSVELVAAGEATASFLDGMDVSTKYALQMSQKLSADLGLGSINKSAFQVGMGGTPVISDEVRSQYFRDKYLGGIGTAAGVGGAAGYGLMAGVGALGAGGSLGALIGAAGLVGIGTMVGGGAAIAGAGYYGYATIADNADESPAKMRELLKMQAAQNKLDRETQEFAAIAKAANDTIGAERGVYVGGVSQQTIENDQKYMNVKLTRQVPRIMDRTQTLLGSSIEDPRYANLEYDPNRYVETEKKVQELQRKREVAGRFGNTAEVDSMDKQINNLRTKDFKVEAYLTDRKNEILAEATAAAAPGFKEAMDASSDKAQERYASSSDFMKRVLSREVVNPLTNQSVAYGAFEAQATAVEKFAQEGGDASLLGFAGETQEAQDKLKSGTIAFKNNEKVLALAEKYDLSVDARELAEVEAQPLRDEKAKLEEDRNKALAVGATYQADQITAMIDTKQSEIDAITFDDTEWANLPASLRRVKINVEALAGKSGAAIEFAGAEAAKQLNSLDDYQVQAKMFSDNTMDRAFQRRQQRFDTTVTGFARQAIMGLGKPSAPNLTARELGSSGGAGLVIDNTVQARAQNMMLSSVFMPENPQYNQHIIKELTTAQQAAVEEQLNIARTNRQVALSNAPEAQLYKSGFTNFVMAMNVAGATAEDLGRSFINTMNMMSEGNPRYGLDLAQQMTGFSYDSMIGMQLRPRGNDEKGNPISSLNGLNGQPYSGSGPMVMPYTSGPRGTIAYSRDMMAVNANGVRENALGIAPSQWQQFVSNATNANAELQRRGMSNAIQERDLNKNHQRNLEDIARNGMRQLESIHLNYTRNMQQLTMQADLVKGTTRANAARTIAMAAIDPTRKEQISSQYYAQDRYFQHIGQGDSVNFLKDSSNIADITAIDPSLSADISALETTNAAYENSAITDPNRQDLQDAKRATIEPILAKLRGLMETETDPIKRASLQRALVQLSPDASYTIAGQNENDKWLKQTLGDAITEAQLGQQISDQEFQNKFRPLDIANDAASGAEAAKSQDPLALLNYSRSSDTMFRGFGQADKALNDTKNSLAGLTGTAHMFEETSQTAIGQIAAGIGSATQSVLYSVDDFEISFQQQMEDALRNFGRQRLDMIQAFADAAVEIASIVPEEMIPIMQATSAFMNTQRQAELLWLSGRTDEANALAYQGMLKLGEVVYGEGKGKDYADKYSQNFQDMADVAARDVPQGDLGKFAVKTEDGWALLVKTTDAPRVYDRPPPNSNKKTLDQGNGAFVTPGGTG